MCAEREVIARKWIVGACALTECWRSAGGVLLKRTHAALGVMRSRGVWVGF